VLLFILALYSAIITAAFFFVKSKVFGFCEFSPCFCCKTAFKQEIIVANLPVYDKMKIGYTYYYMCIYKDNVLNRRKI